MVNTFPKGNYSKMNVIARLENELAYYDCAVYRFNHYTTKKPHLILCELICKLVLLLYLHSKMVSVITM